MLQSWVFPAFLTFVFWGLWAFVPKLVIARISPFTAIVYEAIGSVIVAAIVLIFFRDKVHFTDLSSGGLAIFAGVCGMVGVLSYFWAIKTGPVSIVITVTALYPILAILLALVFLNEAVTVKQIIGMVFALIGVGLIASK